jgi:hypothetical protein
MQLKIFSLIFGFVSIATGLAQPVVSLESLLKEMTNRDVLARYPNPYYTCRQFSSYDRATISKDQPGWFANWDRGMFIRKDITEGREEFVMMDTEGPGAIVRFWMTFGTEQAGHGILRIYIDSNPQPVITGEAFDVLSGNLLAGKPLASSVSELSPYRQRGHNLYLPIPYAKQCKVTYQVNSRYQANTNDVFYNINHRTYVSPVKTISYSAAELKKNRALISKVNGLFQIEENDIKEAKLLKLDLNSDLKPGGSKSFVITGSNAIRHIAMQLQANKKEQALRSTVLEISFDGETTVWIPVGDFFGVGYHTLYTSTWYTHAIPAGRMEAFWVMPFKEKCIITLHNTGEQDVTICSAAANYGKWEWDEHSMHFGVTWRQYTHVYAGAHEQAMDLNFAMLEGKGIYAGDNVILYNTASHTWWGEGDEKIFVDGETFPSHIGTGTEDYYGYAWGLPAPFTDHPFIAQPDGSGNLKPGYVVNTRYRGLDKIPFSKSIQFDMELFQWTKTRINYAPVAYWYMLPGGKNLVAKDTAGVKEKVALNRSDIYSNKLVMSIEGENMEMRSITGGEMRYQADGRWSNGMQLYLLNIKMGNRAEFQFECDYPGEYLFVGLFTFAPDYGKFNIYLNDRKIADKLNLQYPGVTVGNKNLGQVKLLQGQNTITIELAEFPTGQTICCFGLDKLTFTKVTEHEYGKH